MMHAKVNTLIIDDEKLARDRLLYLAEQVPDLSILGTCSSGTEAIQDIIKLKPDLIFLDIQMLDLTGFDVLQSIPRAQMPIVIFVTAYDEHAIQAFEFQAFDFLLKPFKDQRFYDSVERVIQQIRITSEHQKLQTRLNSWLENMAKPVEADSSVTLKMGNSYRIIHTDQIWYILSASYYVEIFTSDGRKHLYRSSMKNILSVLANPRLVQIHRSTIIHLDFLFEIKSLGQGEYIAIMQNDRSFSIGDQFKKGLFSLIKSADENSTIR